MQTRNLLNQLFNWSHDIRLNDTLQNDIWHNIISRMTLVTVARYDVICSMMPGTNTLVTLGIMSFAE